MLMAVIKDYHYECDMMHENKRLRGSVKLR